MTAQRAEMWRTDAPIPGRVWWLAVVLAFGGVLAGLDASIVNVGLAAIGTDLGVSLSAAQWIQSGYLLALAAALPVCGWVSRRVGPGRLWLWALAGFTMASGLCALAPTVEVLVAFRVLQGLAGGLLVPAGMTILGQVAGPARMGRVMATTSVPAILAPAVGPVVGALLLSNLSWQWLFLVNLPVGALGLLLGLRVVPRGKRAPGDRLDVPGLVLVALGLPLLTYAITGLTEQQAISTAPVAAAALGLLALIGFIARSRATPSPLSDLGLFASRVYRSAAFEVFFNGAVLFGGLIVMPLYFQVLLGRDIVDTGLLLIAFSVGAAATFPVAGWLTDRFGGGRITVVGLLITAATTLPFALMPAGMDLVTVQMLQVLRGIGLALSGMPAVSSAFATVQAHQMPDASAQINVLSRVGGAIGSAVFIVILTSGLAENATGAASSGAFRTTFWWLTAATTAALVGAAWLTYEQRRAGATARRAPRPEESKA